MARRSPQDFFGLLWKEYFRDPSQWWDNRTSKAGPAFPDFQHKVTRHSLWIYGRFTPPWVVEELRKRGLAVLPLTHASEVCTHTEQAIQSKVIPFNDVGTAYVALLRACAKKKDLFRGTQVHNDIMKRGLLEQCSDALVTMYAKCGALDKAKELLGLHKSKDVFSWTSLIAGYARKGQGQDALDCFEQMQLQGLSPDSVTFACLLKACGSIKAAEKGKEIHDEITRQGLLGNSIVLGNALVDMYAKCGFLTKAQEVLDELPVRDVVSWSSLIQGYAEQGQGEEALNCFERMKGEGISPNAVTFMCILKACGSIGVADRGERIHEEIKRKGLLRKDVVLGTALVDMYAKCGALEKAQQVLEELCARDVVSWNALIARYAQQGQGEQALDCFERMKREGLSPDSVTFLGILKACGSIRAVEKGENIHDEMSRQGLLQNNVVLGTALVDMYVKCGALVKARQVLEELPVRDVIAWSALIAGYTQQGQAEQALDCFERMQREGFSPNKVTFLCIVKACSSIGAADKGEQIHDEIVRQGLLKKDIVLGNALVDMYAKCGALGKARQVLEELPIQNIVSWNVLIAAYAQEGQGEQALGCFEQMQREGLSPNAVTFLCILKACGSMGLVENAENYFDAMSAKHGIKPDVEHYTCIIDVFGRAGRLDKAVYIIQKMPSCEYSLAVWSALLGACQKWADVKVGKWAFEHAVKIDESDAAAYVLMANIYAAAGMLEDVKIVEAMRIDNKACKRPAYRWWVDMNGESHSFIFGDTQHSQGKLFSANVEEFDATVSTDAHTSSLYQMCCNHASKHSVVGVYEKFSLGCTLCKLPDGETSSEIHGATM